MLVRKAYKFELMPRGDQQRAMRRYAGCCRAVFNMALAWQKTQDQADPSIKFSYVTIANMLPQWKVEMPWLSEAPSQALQQSLKNLESAYKHFFAKHAAFPRFKKKGMGDSFRYPQSIKLDQGNSRIFLPKLGWTRYRNSRAILGEVKNVTVTQRCGKWYASIQTEHQVDDVVHPSASAVGIDVGISRLATLSDGSHFPTINSFKAKQMRLARYQRAMARKVKFSKNWLKAKAKVSRIHAEISDIRKDYLHKVTTAICKKHTLVVIEDLQVSNMSRSAAGTQDAPGRNVKAKSGLNKSIMDQGWFEFRRQLEYKQAWMGGELIAVPPKYTSQRCSMCGHVAKQNRTTQARFECVSCGHSIHADLNAARNILAAGHAVLACGETVQSGHSAKQEPTEGKHLIPSEPVEIPCFS